MHQGPSPASELSSQGYRKSFQEALLTHLLHDKDLLRDAVNKLEITDFDLAVYQAVWEAMRSHYLEFEELPTTHTFWLTVCRVVSNADGKSQSEVRPEEYEALKAIAAKVMYVDIVPLRSLDADLIFFPVLML